MGLKSTVKHLSSKLNYTLNVKLNGKSFKVPIVRNMGLLNRALEDDWFLELLKSFKLPNDSSFVDIGVNVGQTLLRFRSCYDNPYWGFEPNPSCVYYLDLLIEANGFKRVRVLPVGLSSQDQLAEFYVKNEVDSAGTIVKDLRPGYYDSESVKYVPLFRFDHLKLDQLQNIGLIKIDVEGAELEVLAGMTEILKKHQPLVICEILDCHSQESIPVMQERANRLVDLVRSANYTIHRILHSDAKIRYEQVDAVTLKLWTPESFDLNDYLFAPAGYLPR